MKPYSTITLGSIVASSLLSALLGTRPVNALPAISRVGRYLYDESGTRFFIKGVAYQEQGTISDQSEEGQANGGFPEPSSYVDPLADASACRRDLPYLQQLGVNAVRIYSVNASLDHSECMSLFEGAGIYTIIDLSLPQNGSINRASPAWTTNLLDLYTTTIEVFNQYDNVLAYNIGNEVVTLSSNTDTAPFIKAAARDTKAFIKSINSTALVGYSSTDGDNEWRNPLATYLSCASDETSIDLYGLNNYRWCGGQTYNSSGWSTTTQLYQNLTIPAYFSEYGCNSVRPRIWDETPALYQAPATDVWSGGVAFSYFPDSQNYGLITLSNDNTSVVVSTEFTNLAARLSNITTSSTPTRASVSNAQAPACPTGISGFDASINLPNTPDESVCNCLEQSAFPCVRTDTAARLPTVVGALLDYGCSLLGSTDPGGASCDNIGANGTSGSYGEISFCSPDIKLSYVFSAYYVAQGFDAQACSFAGNATRNANAPTSANAASNAAQSCLARRQSDGVFTPTVASTTTISATRSSTSAASATASSSGGGRLNEASRFGIVGWLSVGLLSVLAGGTFVI
ncbi:glycoside hydrolase family 72 protein [Phaffia rhodozyma]|uniref:1,3-beta-glucanosyltransferase n=1 Tax=Phaffia rhodozyma TaxID=264483 RepID=A0A0F7SRW7_PHARH|nr:glycoside hydrolase family 72 protein [Phaffia rhodozyma]